jgi:hypothetical protein
MARAYLRCFPVKIDKNYEKPQDSWYSGEIWAWDLPGGKENTEEYISSIDGWCPLKTCTSDTVMKPSYNAPTKISGTSVPNIMSPSQN